MTSRYLLWLAERLFGLLSPRFPYSQLSPAKMLIGAGPHVSLEVVDILRDVTGWIRTLTEMNHPVGSHRFSQRCWFGFLICTMM